MIDESGSRDAAELWEAADRVASSRLLYPEGRSALALALRLGRLRAGYRAAVASFEALFEQLDLIEVSEALAREAGRLAESHSLRAFDAVHLASARSLADAAPIVVTWDRELARAAATARMSVAPAPD